MSEITSRESGMVAPSPAAATPARVFLGRTGTSLRTRDLLELRADHAAARDAVRARLEDEMAALEPLAALIVDSRAASPEVYLRRPDLGRALDEAAVAAIRERGTPGARVQIVIGDGLSARAVGTYAPAFVAQFTAIAAGKGWSLGRVIAVRHARVGLMNEIGELLGPEVVLLLIGERPGMDIQTSLSAYLGYRPARGHTDADRDLISSIHDSGILPADAASEAAAVVERLLATRASGVAGRLVAGLDQLVDGGDSDPAGTGRCRAAP